MLSSESGLSQSRDEESDQPSVIEHRNPSFEVPEHDAPPQNSNDPTTKRFLRIEDVWM